MFISTPKLSIAVIPAAIASIVITLFVLSIELLRLIPLSPEGTSVGTGVWSGFSVGTGAIVGRAGDVGFGVGADGSTHLLTVVEAASNVPFEILYEAAFNSLIADLFCNVKVKSSAKASFKAIVIVTSLPFVSAIPLPVWSVVLTKKLPALVIFVP